ncbi:hypothetical protein XCR1_1270013 [Xenorhabdus cabanillasii JM26]|uniref:Uncharacterized protein n=1 Tax=Xenorhabdus cabanillasii JM26 TaxID=1427517 RepID=W1IQH2_9GAMM|nr:hypothetical protein XCR1_1270013 [Xenorhabdus cabanillasii JM26]
MGLLYGFIDANTIAIVNTPELVIFTFYYLSPSIMLILIFNLYKSLL